MIQVSDAGGSVLSPGDRRGHGRTSLFTENETPNPSNSRQLVKNYIPILLKTLKDVKQDCAQHGPTAPLFCLPLILFLEKHFFPLNERF